MRKLIFFKVALILFCLLCGGQMAFSQDLLKGKDLSTIRVDQLSDADIAKLKAQLTSSGLTIDQAEQMALAKGMSQAEFNKLKARLAGASETGTSAVGKLKATTPEENRQARPEDIDSSKYDKKPKTLIDSLIFGSELYTSIAPSFEPNLQLATPVNYILGPNDRLQVSVDGIQVYSGEHTITPEGFVSIPNVGQIHLAGMTIEAATQKLKTAMGNSVYRYLLSGGSKLTVTLTKIRTIRVTIIGANRPGNFNVSSLSTVFNALFIAGGPSAFGSFRQIELIRDNKPLRVVDLYRFLVNGDQQDNIGLKDNDVIRIPAYKTRMELRGQVKRPGIFEVLPGESFSDVLRFASGFTDTAYRAGVKVFQQNERERVMRDLLAKDYDAYHPQTGDVIAVSKILNRFQNRVKITGAVFRPDVYELSSNMKVGDLIRISDGLREDAFTGRAQIIRIEDDLTRSLLSFDVKKALAGDAAANIPLKREDEVLISSVQELKDSLKVQVQGEVRRPGAYDYVEKLTLKDLILQAGGFTDAAYKNIEIARLIKRDSIAASDNRASAIIHAEIEGDLASQLQDIPLQPFDVVTIRRKAGYTLPESVIVTGQVQYPGPYALNKLTDRVSDILQRAGGYLPDAYPSGAFIRRYPTDLEKEKTEKANEVSQKFKKAGDTTQIMETPKRSYEQIPLDMEAIRKNPGGLEDINLRARDELVIPKYTAEIKVSKGVLVETQLPYDPKYRFTDYISGAGGYSRDAWKRGAYIVYANGRAAATKHFLFFRSYPKVLPGSEIVVPKKAEKKGLGTGEIIGIASALASLAGVVIAILNL